MPVYLPVFAFLLSGAQAAAEPLQPIGKWNLDAGENACVLAHRFGTPDQTWSVGFKSHVGAPQMDVVLIGPRGWDIGQDGVATVTLRPSGATFSGGGYTASLQGGMPMRRISVDHALLDAMPTTTELAIGTKRNTTISFAIPTSAGAFAALKSCDEQLLQSWGVDPARFRRMVPPGQPGFVDLSKYLMADDYPEHAEPASGKTMALLSLDADGKVKTCRVIESSGTPELDARTCQIAVSRLRYPPIRNAAGQNVESWTVLALNWVAARY